MAEYINRKDLLDYLEKLYKILKNENGQYDPYTEGFCSCMDKVEGFSASNVQPVQHGQWITEDEYYVDDTYICSACGYEFIITAGDLESNELNYCPKCGAKMDEGEDDGI